MMDKHLTLTLKVMLTTAGEWYHDDRIAPYDTMKTYLLAVINLFNLQAAGVP